MKLGTGMNIYFVGNQKEILKLKKNQKIGVVPGETQSGKPKVEFQANGKCLGMFKQEAVQKLMQEITGNWDQILYAEVAQVIQTETKEDKREYNEGLDTHYYIVPRLFYTKS